jgi:ATP-dependent Clp protease ATP-binding subunit ClpC
MIVFHKLSKDDITEICGKMLELVKGRMKAVGIDLKVEKGAIELLSEQGYDPVYGARPLRRVIQNAVEDTVAERLLESKIKDGDAVTITAKGDKIEVV